MKEVPDSRLRFILGMAGAVYLAWWLMVELLLPGSFNPLPGRLVVVGLCWALLAASYRNRWVASRLSTLFTGWVCLLVAHYVFLLIGNHGDSTWWVGAFVTFAGASMCLSSRREVAVFSVVALGCAVVAAATLGQLAHAIYVPGLATILLLANLTKRSQVLARRADGERLQLAAIVESSGDAILACSPEGVIRTWNKGAERLFGHTAEDVVGRPLSLLLPGGRDGEEPALIARLTRGEPAAPFETVRRRKDGSELDVSVTVSPIRDAAGDLVGVSLAARDISDRKRAEAEALRAQQAAEDANRELEAFSYSVAHDLRAPLRAISGFSEILLQDHAPELGAEGQRHLRRVRDAAQQMGRLIDGLLALGRLTRVSLRTQQVDLSELARAAAQRLKESQPDRVVELVIADGLVERGDGALLGAVLENLLGNAWKFTREQKNPRIEFGVTHEHGENAYFVRDNGAGFDMAFASKLFGVFERLHPATEFEGTGVGLATVQRIVHRHGGRVWGEGKVGQGACFHFTFGGAADP